MKSGVMAMGGVRLPYSNGDYGRVVSRFMAAKHRNGCHTSACASTYRRPIIPLVDMILVHAALFGE